MLRIKNRAAGKNTKSLGNPYSSDNNEAPVEKYPFPKHPPSRSSSNSVESVIPFSLETVSHHLSRTSGTPRWKQPCYPIPIVSPFSFVAMSRIVNEIPLRDKRRPPVLVSGRIPLSEEAMFNEVLKELYYEDSSVCEGDRIGGTGGEGWLIGRKYPRKIPSLPLRLIRHSKSTPRFPESFRASWLSTLLSSSFFGEGAGVAREYGRQWTATGKTWLVQKARRNCRTRSGCRPFPRRTATPLGGLLVSCTPTTRLL